MVDMDLDKITGNEADAISQPNPRPADQSQSSAQSQSPAPAPAPGSQVAAPTSVAKRKPHSKSRLGCQQCKQRKVKCDETKPSCKKCLRNDTECSFLKLQPNIFRPSPVQKVVQEPSHVRIKSVSSQSSLSAKSNLHHVTQGELDSQPQLLPKPIQLPLPGLLVQRGPKSPDSFLDSPQASTLSPATTIDLAGRVYSAETGTFDMLDMQLYHHYMTETSLTMSQTRGSVDGRPVHNEGIKGVWHHTFTEWAFKHDFLMHILLSLSAFHMSSKHHHRKLFWLSVKTKHQELGISSFRFAVGKMTKHNVHACWAFSLVLAVTEKPGNMCDFDSIESGVGFVALMRGGIRMYDPYMSELLGGPLNPFFQAWVGRVATRFDMDPEDIRRLDRVSDYWGYDASAEVRAKSQPLEEALEHLRGSFAMYTSDTNIPELGPVMSWAGVIPEAFMQMVLAKQTGALIVLAHFCVLISRLRAWWIEDEAVTLLTNVMKYIDKADEHWIRWPIEQVFNQSCST